MVLSSVFLGWLVPVTAHAATLDVGVGQAYPSVSAAVAAAASGDVVRIHPGTYDDHVTVSAGSLTLESASGPDTVVLRGTSAADGFLLVDGTATVTVRELTFDGQLSHRNLVVDDGGTLDGFDLVIRGGGATTKGAGLHVRKQATATLTRAVLTGHVVTDSGAAIHVANDGVLVVLDSVLSGNHADGKGGAIQCKNAADCAVTHSVLIDNTATDGGACDAAGTTFRLSSSLLAGNHAQGNGGALNASSPIELLDNVWCENTADNAGGAVQAGDATVLNNHFIGNTATGLGGAVHSQGAATFTNNLVWANTSPSAAVHGPTHVDLSYSWFFDNSADDYAVATEGAGVSTGVSPEVLSYVPGDCRGSDLHLAAGSPLRDAGDPSGPTDPDGTTADIGAYEPEWDGIDPGGSGTGTDTGNATDTGIATGNDTGTDTGTAPGTDSDGDGVDDADDCAPTDPTIYPGAPEVADDGVDQNCTGSDLVVTYGGGAGCTMAPSPAAALWPMAWMALLGLRRRRAATS